MAIVINYFYPFYNRIPIKKLKLNSTNNFKRIMIKSIFKKP